MTKLKNKVFIVILGILTLFLITILFIFNYQDYYTAKKTVLKNLNKAAGMGSDFNNKNRYDLDKRIINPKKEEYFEVLFMDSVIYTVILDSNNSIIHIINNSNNVITLNEIKDIANEIIKDGMTSNIKVKNLYFNKYSYIYNSGNYLIITDTSNIKYELLKNLRLSFLLFMILESLIVFISYKITNWIIRPVISAFEKQKRFIADASHELKTPLAVIMASGEALENEPNEKKWLNNIKSESERMNELIKSLLDLAKIEDEEIREKHVLVNVSKIVELSSLTCESLMYEKDITLKTSIQDNIELLCNAEQIKELMSILLDNAISHTIKKGTIMVKLYKNNNYIILEVVNKGKPIAKDEEEKIFERFYRSDKSRNRSDGRYGLGLAIAKKIVLNHNGKITAHSQNGYTTFRVQFKQFKK